ncbi:unnamed protein product [Tenebrio molitor]|nr:unnamed protein product [Tenebrio molitor]
MWEKIALSFNSQTIGVNRDAKVLKEKWTNFKRVTVKKYASDKTNINRSVFLESLNLM